MTPTRRTVLLAGAAAALFPSAPATAAPKAAAATQPYASYWYPDSSPRVPRVPASPGAA